MLLHVLCVHRRSQESTPTLNVDSRAPGGVWGVSLDQIVDQLPESKMWEEGEAASLLNKLSILAPPEVAYCEESCQYYLNEAQYRKIRGLIGRGNYPKKDHTEPEVRLGVMAADSAVRADMSTEDWNQMAVELAQRELIGLEMEVSGVYGAVGIFNDRNVDRVQGVLIKGVSDVASPEKDDQFHKYGKQISAAFVYKFLIKYGYPLVDKRPENPQLGETDEKKLQGGKWDVRVGVI